MQGGLRAEAPLHTSGVVGKVLGGVTESASGISHGLIFLQTLYPTPVKCCSHGPVQGRLGALVQVPVLHVANAAGQKLWATLCVQSLGPPPQECLMLSVTGISRGLTSFHMSYQEGQADSSQGSGWLSSLLPFWEACTRPSSPLPAARWVGGPRRSGPLPSPLVACGHSYWGKGGRPG